ncbi:MAG: hypothetical protein RB191_13415 [Terriglobia bacterium]|nr:hypothetical protein [Terriglobia bacterium]
MPNRSVQLELDPKVSVAPQSIGGAVNGAGVDLAGCDAALILLDSGAATTPATVKVQESVDDTTFTDVADSDLIGLTGNAAGVAQVADTVVKVSYIGSQRYVRVVTTAGAAALFSAEVLLAHLRRGGPQPV